MKYKFVLLIFITMAATTAHAQSSLPAYLDLAYANSPLINDNKNQGIANQAEAERIRAATQKLQLGINANYLFAPVYVTDGGRGHFDLNSTGATNYYGYDLGVTNGGNFQGLVSINQPLFAAKRADILAKQPLVAGQINTNTIKITRHDLEKSITDQYIMCLLDKKQVENSTDNMQIIDQQRFIVKKLVNSSLLKNSDLILLNIEYENNQNILLTYKAAYHKDVQELKLLSGSRDTTINMLDSLSLTIKDEPASSLFTEKYKLDSLNLVATQKAFETKYQPQLNLFANSGLNAAHIAGIQNRFGVSAGLNLSWAILDGHQKDISRRKTNALLQSVSFYKSNFEFQNSQRKTQLLDELQSYDARVKNQYQQLKDYRSLLNSYRTQVIQAQLSVIDFINVLKNKVTVQRDLLQLETNRLLLINAYNYWNW
jgi:outer membrane protein TolC